ncbi:MAG: hypothetical protein M0R73_10865 [Dehalococcoidia bacterium]|nr:hypothetical protein [Dehalococcoidia bacterium]
MPSPLNATIGHLRRLATLDLDVFDDLRFDASATAPAIVVAVTGMALLGLGGWLWWVTTPGLGDTASVFLKTVILGTIFGAGAWLAWLLVIYAVLRQLSRITVPMEQLLRTAGFAAAPLVLGLGMVVPSISFGVGLVALAAWVATTHVAVERTVGRGGGDVLAANLAGFAVWAIVMSLLATGSNQIGPGPFLAESIWDAISGRTVTFG